MRRAVLSFLAVSGCVAAGCGSRGPLDDDVSIVVNADAGPTPDAIAPLDATTIVDASRPPVEAGVAACAGCVIETCGPGIVSCLQSEQCAGVFQCVATGCLGLGGDAGPGGGLDPQCLLGCLGKNPAGALSVISIFQCVSGRCADGCGSILGGLGGLGGLLGGGGGSSSGGFGGIDRIDAEAYGEVFSPWPELVSHAP